MKKNAESMKSLTFYIEFTWIYMNLQYYAFDISGLFQKTMLQGNI